MLQPETDSQYQADAKKINKQMPGRASSTTEMLRGQKIQTLFKTTVWNYTLTVGIDHCVLTTRTIMCGMALLFWPCNFILNCG